MMKPQQTQPESRTQTILILCLILFLFNVPTVKPTPTHTQQKQKAAAAAETFLHPFIPLHVNWEQGSGEWEGGQGDGGLNGKSPSTIHTQVVQWEVYGRYANAIWYE